MNVLNTKILKSAFLVAVFAMLVSCDENEVAPDEQFKNDGYIITGATDGDVSTVYAGYFETIPEGDIDLVSNATAFTWLRIMGVQNGYLFGRNNNNTLIKYGVDAETNAIVKVDEFALNADPGNIVFIDNETAVVSLYDSKDIRIFNPSTMELSGQIDLSQGVSFEENDATYISQMIYNEVTNKIYAIVYTALDATPQYYDAEAIHIEVIDAATLQWEKTITHENAEYPIFRGEDNAVIDESGNTYIIAQGTYGLDNQFGPTAPAGSKPQILKINTSSEFDESYAFNPIDALGFQNNYFQLFTSMIYVGNNKAIGVGTAQSDDPQILTLLQKFAAGTLTDEEYGTLVSLVLYNESMKFVEIDLLGKSVTEIPNIPFTAGFSYPFMYEIDGSIYGQFTTNAKNGFYEINPQTGAFTEKFSLSTGGTAYQLVDLSGQMGHE